MARVDGVIGDSEAKKYFYHTDQVGSVRDVSNDQGQVVWKADYLAFGSRYGEEGMFEEERGFGGKELDEDTGLYYFNARWYDSELGRFISEDQVMDPNNPNLYSYCANNPLNHTDPTGNTGEDSGQYADDTLQDSQLQTYYNGRNGFDGGGGSSGSSSSTNNNDKGEVTFKQTVTLKTSETIETYFLNITYGGKNYTVIVTRTFQNNLSGDRTTQKTIIGEEGKIVITEKENLGTYALDYFRGTFGAGFNPTDHLHDSLSNQFGGTLLMAAFSLGSDLALMKGVEFVGKFGSKLGAGRSFSYSNSKGTVKFDLQFFGGPSKEEQITVIGKWWDTDVASEWAGHNTLKVPLEEWNSWTREQQWAKNVQWLDEAIARGDRIYLASDPKKYLGDGSFFSDEVKYLQEKGYKIVGNYMAKL